jgi:hypothetical protein
MDMTSIERMEPHSPAKPQILEGIVGFGELQRQLGFRSPHSVHNLINRGCPSFRLGNRRMFVAEDVRAWLLKQPHAAAEVRKPGRPPRKAK